MSLKNKKSKGIYKFLHKPAIICFCLFLCSAVFAQKKLAGQVHDTKGEPVVGALVQIKGTNKQSSTDLDGYFLLRNVTLNDCIEISYIGMQNKEIKYNGQDNIYVILHTQAKKHVRWGFSWGVEGMEGNTYLDPNFIGDDLTMNTIKVKWGIITTEIPLKSNFSLLSGLYLTGRLIDLSYSVHEKSDYGNYYSDNDHYYNRSDFYLQIPVNLMYKLNLSSKVRLGGSAGIYAGYEIYHDEGEYNDDMDFWKEIKWNKWDIGLNLGIRFEFWNFFYEFQYNQALLKMSEFDKTRHGGFLFSYGFLF